MTAGLFILMLLMLVAMLACIDRASVVTPPGGRPARLLESVWVPLLMVLPNTAAPLRHLPQVGVDVLANVSSAAIGAGIVIPWMLLGPGRDRGRTWGVDDAVPMGWPVLGVLLLLMAVADSIPTGAGLVVFALVTVLAWCQSIPRAGESYGGPGAGWLLAAAVCSVMAWLTSFALGADTVLLTVCVQIGVCWVICRRRGQRAAVLAAGWAAAFGVGMTTGLLGHSQVMATIIPIPWLPIIEPTWPLSIPGLLVMLMCGCVAVQHHWPRSWQWAWGVGTAAFSLGVLAWLIGS